MELRTGDSYWALRSGLLHSYPPVRSDQSAEVVVLGAGITGTLIARALALEGADVYLASSESARAQLRREYLNQAQHRFDVSWFNRQAVEGFYGFSAAAAMYCGGDGEIDCYRFVHALMADAASRGVRVFDRTGIVRITAGRNGVVLETDRGHRITAGRFISAAGYQTEDELLRTPATPSSTWAIVSAHPAAHLFSFDRPSLAPGLGMRRRA